MGPVRSLYRSEEDIALLMALDASKESARTEEQYQTTLDVPKPPGVTISQVPFSHERPWEPEPAPLLWQARSERTRSTPDIIARCAEEHAAVLEVGRDAIVAWVQCPHCGIGVSFRAMEKG